MSDPRQTLIASWVRNADLWSDAVRAGKVRSRVLVTDAAIVAAAMAFAPRHVLDLGCGEGWLCRALTAAGVPRVTGVDAAAPLVAAAEALGSGPFLCHSYEAIIDRPAILGEGFDLAVANFALLDDRAGPLLAALAGVMAPGGHLLIQTVHPACVEGPYEDGWRTEQFAAFGGGDWTAMPWYFRTLGSWLDALRPTWNLTAIAEPVFPDTGRPASLILTAAHDLLETDTSLPGTEERWKG